MKNSKKLFNTLPLLGFAILLISSCDLISSLENQKVPVLSTLEVTDITQTTAMTGGNISDDGGVTVTARGVCWSTGQTPTIEDNKTEDGTGAGSFTSKITGLELNTTYYARAYATNSGGTGYGSTMSFTTSSFGTMIVEVTNPVTGKTWMDRNLGAARAATSSTDAEAYGDLYQWGRGTDGHEKRNSQTTNTLSSGDSPGHGSFVIQHFDWRSSQNDNLWQGVSGVNNPCPPGYRVPTEAELIAEFESWNSVGTIGAFASPLKLPLTGYREFLEGGLLTLVGARGFYWSSTVSNLNSRYLNLSNNGALIASGARSSGTSVRCLKD